MQVGYPAASIVARSFLPRSDFAAARALPHVPRCCPAAREVTPDGVRVSCLAPSAVLNDKMRAWVPAPQREALGAGFPLGRPGDVANAALFLASAASAWITGITLDIAGGKIMI
jgi:NAD(P)-dependent dehydrogenase (short-subunit alcohol dehydrogenase family)